MVMQVVYAYQLSNDREETSGSKNKRIIMKYVVGNHLWSNSFVDGTVILEPYT